MAARLRDLLAQGWAWTSRQLADAFGPGSGIGHRQTRRYLALLKAGSRRTARTVARNQDPPKVERAKAVLAGLEKVEPG